MRQLALLVSLCLCSSAFSRQLPLNLNFEFLDSQSQMVQTNEQSLVTIISQPQDNLEHECLVGLDEDKNFASFIRRSPSSEQVVPSEDLFEGEVLIAQASGRDALFLSCLGCSRETGGEVKLRYLYNGMSMSYRNFTINLGTIDGEWKLITEDGEIADTLTLVSRTVMGRVIGIKRIDVNSR